MQDRYVADIGDFGKFQLYRYLFNPGGAFAHLALTQVWFYHDFEADAANNDGRHIHYFERVAHADPQLAAIMQKLLIPPRSLRRLEASRILENVAFFTKKVPRAFHQRAHWLQQCMQFAVTPAVAVAPDNGIALHCDRDTRCFRFATPQSKKRYHWKYIYKAEIDTLYHAPQRQILILYQHLGRCMPHQIQSNALHRLLCAHYPFVTLIKHKPYSPRLFAFLLKEEALHHTLQHSLSQFAKRLPDQWEYIG